MRVMFPDSDEACLSAFHNIVSVSDGVRLREGRRGGGTDPRSGSGTYSSRRSSTDSSEDGFNLNVRDLKVSQTLCQCKNSSFKNNKEDEQRQHLYSSYRRVFVLSNEMTSVSTSSTLVGGH